MTAITVDDSFPSAKGGRSRRGAALALLVLAVGHIAGGCGGGSGGGDDPLPPPGESDPAHGEAADFLVEDSGLRMWIGVDDDQVATEMRENFLAGRTWWIVGEVVPDTSRAIGFYFDPSTIFTAEVTIEAIQTNLDQIRADPAYYAPGTSPFDAWAVAPRILKMKTG